jgi:AsmA-like protein/uncharacterized protein DUF3971
MASMGSPRQRVKLRRKNGSGAASRPRRRRPWRAWQVAVGALAGIVGLSGLAAGAVALRLAMGPVVIDSEQVRRELGGLLGRSWGIGIAEVAIENSGWRPALRMSGVEIKNPEGLSVLQAPRVVVALDVGKLFVGSVRARSIAFSGLDLKVAVAKDGSLALTAGATSEPVKASPSGVKVNADADETARAKGGPAALGVAAASLLELLTATDGLVGTLDEASIDNARLTLVDDSGAARFTFSDVMLGFARPRDNLRHVTFGLTGGKGRWAVDGTVARRGSGGRVAALKFNNVPVSDLLVLAGKSQSLATTDMPLSGAVRIASGPGGELASLDAEINGGSSVIHSTDPDMSPIDVDAVKLVTSWDPAFGAIVVKEASVRAGTTHIAVNGRLDASGPGGVWRLALNGQNAVMSALTPGEKPITVERIEFQMVGADGGGALVERCEISGTDYGVGLTASFGTGADQGGMRVAIAGARSVARPILRFWPSFAGRNVRDYLIGHLKEGIVESFSVNMNMSADDIAKSQTGQPLPDSVGKTEFSLSNVELAFADGLPPIRNATVTGSTTGRTAKVLVPQAVVPLASGRSLGFTNGSLAVADTAQKRAPGVVNFKLAGGADAFVNMLGSDSLRALAPIDIDPAVVKGNADLRVAVTLPLHADVKMGDIQVGAKGGLSGLGIEGLVGKDKLENANLALSLDGAMLSLKGEGKVAGLTTGIELKQPVPTGSGEAIITTVLDEAARASRGLSFGKQLTGPVTVKVITPLVKVENRGPRVELDLVKAKVEDLLPGWSKPAGKPARVAFFLNGRREGGGSVLDEFQLDGSGVLVKGNVELSPNGELEAARLGAFKMSPGDDMRVELDRTDGAYRVSVKGNVVDARPFLRAFSTGADVKSTRDANDSKDFDLDLSANILAGYNDEAMTNATVRMSRRGGELRAVNVAGRFGRAQVAAQLVHRVGQSSQVIVQSDDGGAFLRFADVYRRMSGGELVLSITPNEVVQLGALEVKNFALRNEPALQRLLTQQPPPGTAGFDERSVAARVDSENVPFTTLRAAFVRSAGRFEVRDGIIWGDQIGIKLDGFVDFARDRADLAGTFVPAYALNNVWGKLPLVGPLLTGQRDEGIFAVSFRISGLASAPTLTINPISAIAPGVVRKFFDIFTPSPSQDWPQSQPERRSGRSSTVDR